MLVLGVVAVASSGSAVRADAGIVREVEGKEASIAFLKLAMDKPVGEFCGAKQSKLIVDVDGAGGVTTRSKDMRDVPKSRVLTVAKSLPGNQSVVVLYCVGSGDNLVATGTAVSHVVWKNKSAWTASVIERGVSLPAPEPAHIDKASDTEVEQALAKAARQINKSVPMVVEKGLRLDKAVGANKQLLYSYTLTDHDASAVKADEFRRGMRARLVSGVCEDEAMQVLLENGVRYTYRYHGKDGKEIATISVASRDCD
jgi:hypothetical protein